METNALVGYITTIKNWCSTFEGTKTDGNLSYGVDNDKKRLQQSGRLLQNPGYCETDSTESWLAQYQTNRDINNAAKLPQPLVCISTGGQIKEMAETHTADPNKDGEMTSD